jgi:hypothetical protein
MPFIITNVYNETNKSTLAAQNNEKFISRSLIPRSFISPLSAAPSQVE